MRASPSPRSTFVRLACLALTVIALSGCVIAPYAPYHHWGPRYYY